MLDWPGKSPPFEGVMRVGLDARLLGEPRSGIARYTRQLVAELPGLLAPGEELVLFTDAPLPAAPAPGRVSQRCLGVRHRLLWSLWAMPRALGREPLDCYHSVTGFELPRSRQLPLVSTVHDLVPLSFPGLTPWRYRLAFRLLIAGALRRADRIIAISEATRRELLARFRIPPAKTVVIPLAADERFRPLEEPALRRALRERYGLPEEYLLFVGLLEPKKNLGALLQALALLRREGSVPAELQLLVVGATGWDTAGLPRKGRQLGLEGAVRFLGPVPESDLPGLYSLALGFVFPSLWEGFGLPVLEAMASGTPVVASRRGALPEIVGEAGLLVEPTPHPLAEALARLIADPALRERLRALGIERARAFSWRRAAEATLAVYRAVAA